MCAFRTDPNNRHLVHPDDVLRVDRELLLAGPVALYGPPERLRRHISALESYGYRCPAFDCAEWESEAAMLTTLTGALAEDPAHNAPFWDALRDCLGSLDIPVRGGVALAFWRFDRFVLRFPKLAWELLDLVAGEAWFHLGYGRRLLALAQSDNPELRIEPVGARSVRWAQFEANRSPDGAA